MSCPGVTSQITPGRPLRLCLSCLRYAWGLEGKGTAKHDGSAWTCIEFTGSLSGAQKATPATEATAAGVYHQQKELANE